MATECAEKRRQNFQRLPGNASPPLKEMGRGICFPGQLLHPTMIFPLLFWAEICLLLLCGGCQRVEPATGEWSTLSPHQLNSRAAPAFPSKQRDTDRKPTKIYYMVTGTVASKLGMSQQQQPNWVRLGQREHRTLCLCSQAVCSPCIFPFFVGVAKLLSTGDGAGLHFQCPCVLWGEAGAGDIPLQPLVLPPGCGVPWAALPPHSPAGAGKRGPGVLLGARAVFAGWLLCLLKSLPALRSHAAFLLSMELYGRG